MQGTASCRFCGELWVQLRGCKGRSPLHKKTKSLPLPAGKGVGGMGATKTTNGRGSRRQRRQATPADTTAARSTGNQPGKPPASDTATAGRAGNEKTPPSPQKKPVSLLTGFPPSCNEKGGSMARIPPPDTRFEQFVKIRICIDNHVTVCYNSDTAEEPRRNAP